MIHSDGDGDDGTMTTTIVTIMVIVRNVFCIGLCAVGVLLHAWAGDTSRKGVFSICGPVGVPEQGQSSRLSEGTE